MEQNAASTPNKSRRILILTIAAVLIAVALYVAGFVSGRSPVEDLRAELTNLEEKVAKVTEQRDIALARALLYRGATDLEERNFGEAQERLSEAARLLEGLPPGGGSAGDAIRQLEKQVKGLRIEVSANVETQRVGVLQLARRLDALQPR